MSPLRAAVVLNGPFRLTDPLARTLEGAFVVAADGGFRRLARAGRRPHVVVGDFDSIRPPAGEAIERYPVDKDETDGELAVLRALEEGATHITIVGAFGGRYDMAIGHISLLRLVEERRATGVLTDGRTAAFLVPETETPVGPSGRGLSVIPLSEEARLLSHGLRWPLEDTVLRWDAMRGLSNRAVDDGAWIRRIAGQALAVTAYPPGER